MFEQRGPHESEMFDRAGPERAALVAAAYLEKILRGDCDAALRVVVEQVERGVPVDAIWGDVVQPTADELRNRAVDGSLSADRVRAARQVHHRVGELLRPSVRLEPPS